MSLAKVREIGIEYMDKLRGSILHISSRICARISGAHIRRWYSSRRTHAAAAEFRGLLTSSEESSVPESEKLQVL